MSSNIAEEVNLPALQISSSGIVVPNTDNTILDSNSLRINCCRHQVLTVSIVQRHPHILAFCLIGIRSNRGNQELCTALLVPGILVLATISLAIVTDEAHGNRNSNLNLAIAKSRRTSRRIPRIVGEERPAFAANSERELIVLLNGLKYISNKSGSLKGLQTFPIEVRHQNQRSELLVNESIDDVHLVLNLVDCCRQHGHIILQFLLQSGQACIHVSSLGIVSKLSVNVIDLLSQLSNLCVNRSLNTFNLAIDCCNRPLDGTDFTIDTSNLALKISNIYSMKSLQLLLHRSQLGSHLSLVSLESLLLQIQVSLNTVNSGLQLYIFLLESNVCSVTVACLLGNSLIQLSDSSFEVTLQSDILSSQLFQILLLSIVIQSLVDGSDLCLQGSISSGQTVDRRNQLLDRLCL